MTENQHISSDTVQQALEARSYHQLRQKFKDLESADIAESLSELSLEELAVAFRLVSTSRKAELFSYLPLEIQVAMLEFYPDDSVTVLLNEMEPDDRTTLLEELPPEQSSKYILRLDPEERKMAWRLLSYPEDSVGRMMSPEFFSVPAGMTVSQAIEHIRWNAASYPEEMLSQIFVINPESKYIGDISLGGLFVADPSTQPVESLIGSSYVSLSAYDEQELAVDAFRKYDKTHIAVIDDHEVLVGVVTAEDVFDVAEEEATEDIQQFGGSGILEDSYFQTPIFMLLRKRAGWLVLLFLGGLWSGHALKIFETAISAFPFLVFFLPLVISSGGNSGSQAASLIIRGLAIREMALRDWYRVFGREFVTGTGLGLVLGVMGYVCAIYWGLGQVAGIIVFTTLVGIVIFGAVAGAMLPFMLKRIGLDPAVSSSPLIASIVDLVGILMFFNLAIIFMKLFS